MKKDNHIGATPSADFKTLASIYIANLEPSNEQELLSHQEIDRCLELFVTVVTMGGQSKPSELTHTRLDEYFQRLDSQCPKERKIFCYRSSAHHNYLRSFFDWLVQENIWKTNPLRPLNLGDLL